MQPAFKMLQALRIINGLRGMFRSVGHTLAIPWPHFSIRFTAVPGGPRCATQGIHLEDTKEAIEILNHLEGLYEAELLVVSELADDALWKSGLLDDLITRASKFYRPSTHIR
jgi:hypothetical protein